MSKKVSVVLLCDLHDEQDVEAAETAAFGVDGAALRGRAVRAPRPEAAGGRGALCDRGQAQRRSPPVVALA